MLRTKQVGKWTVSEVGALEGVRMSLFQKQADAYITKTTKNGGELPFGMKETLESWVSLAGCVTPLLSLDEYLATPAGELRPLIDAMSDVNESPLPQTLTTTPEQAKKKRSNKTQTSTSE